MITVEYNAGRCQLLRDGVQLCDISIEEAQEVVSTITRDSVTLDERYWGPCTAMQKCNCMTTDQGCPVHPCPCNKTDRAAIERTKP